MTRAINLIPLLLTLASCSTSQMCGTFRPQGPDSNGLLKMRSYGLSYQAPQACDSTTEVLRFRTKSYELWLVSHDCQDYQMEYFAPKRNKPGMAIAKDLVTGDRVDCEWLESIMSNKYPYHD